MTQTAFRILILLVISLLLPFPYRISAIGLVMLLLLSSFKQRKSMILSGLILLTLIRCFPPSYIEVQQVRGRVIRILNSGFLIESDVGRFMVRADSCVSLDDQVFVTGVSQRFKKKDSFYGFNEERWAYQNQLRARFEAHDVQIVKQGMTCRHAFYQKMKMLPDSQQAALVAKIIFGINDPDSVWDLLNHCGFQFSLLLRLISIISCWIVEKQQTRKVRLLFLILCFLITSGSYPVFRLLLFEFFTLVPLKNDQRWIFKWLVLISCAPYKVGSASFLFPFFFSLMVFLQGRKQSILNRMNLTFILQSLLFHQISLFVVLFGYMLRYIHLFFLIVCIAGLFFPDLLSSVLVLVNEIQQWSDCFPVWYGQISGVLFLLILIVRCFPDRWRSLILNILIVLLTLCECWHPFASVTFINVGQGDSILIRMPYNSTNILIDTGRPSAYPAVKAALQGEGITHLDALIITHDDEDHCGNVESVMKDFTTDRLIEKVSGAIQVGNIKLFNFNEDSPTVQGNPGSMVLMMKMSDLTFVFSGDAPESVEQQIIRSYPELRTDILKIGHHGSNTSSCLSYLMTLRPAVAVNSSGINNRYRHPHPEIVKRLDSLSIPLIDTQHQGDIKIIITRFFKYLFTAGRGFVIIR